MAGLANSVRRRAPVETPVTGVKAGDVKMTDDVSAGAQILPHHQPGAEKYSDQSGRGPTPSKILRLGNRESDLDIDIDSSLIKGGSIIH